MVSVHRVAWMIANGEPPHQVNHRCANKRCWNVQHLYAGTAQENTQDAAVQGGCGSQKLTVPQVDEILAAYGRGGVTQAQLGKRYGVHNATISRIITGRSFAHRHESLARVGG